MMKSRRMLLVAVAVVFFCIPAAVGVESGVKAVIAGNNACALDLYARLAEKDGNLFFSPYSISTALAMTYAGARGNTEAQMAKALHLGANGKELHDAFGALVGDLNAAGAKKGYQLSVANALWAQQDYKFRAEFTDLVSTSYRAGLNKVDFKTAAEQARLTINKWVEEKTKDKIKDLLKPGTITALTRLVLTNAIYFKGDWANQFKKDATQDAPFTLLDGKKVDVPMMNQTTKFKYLETESMQALDMPYIGDDLSMLVFLPKKADGVKELEKSLTADNLANWLMRFRRREVIVFMPRFKMTCEFGLNDVLSAMGMTDAFIDGTADFSGMDGTKYLFISAVVHKAFVDVNEEGTEAAAATGVVVGLTSVMQPEEPPVFRADHPFVFIIRDNKTGSILFMGRVANPKSE